MALTNEDLLAISKLLDTKLDSKLKAELQPVKDSLRDLNDKVDRVEKRLDQVEERLDRVEKRLDQVEERLDEMDKRLDRVERNQEKTDREIAGIKLHLENVTDRNIRLLAENYVPAAKQYEKASAQVGALEADMDIVKNVITDHSRKLQVLG